MSSINARSTVMNSYLGPAVRAFTLVDGLSRLRQRCGLQYIVLALLAKVRLLQWCVPRVAAAAGQGPHVEQKNKRERGRGAAFACEITQRRLFGG